MGFLLSECVCLSLILFLCHFDRTIAEPQAALNNKINNHLREFKIYKWLSAILILINVILFVLFMIFRANHIYDLAKIIMITFNELSILSLILPVIVLIRTNYITSFICKIINWIIFALSIIMSLTYLISPFILTQLDLTNKMQLKIMTDISVTCCLLFGIEIIYLLFVILEYYELDNKIQASKNLLNNKNDLTKVNKYVKKILIGNRKDKGSEWETPLYFSHSGIKLVIGDNKLYKTVMTKFSSDKD